MRSEWETVRLSDVCDLVAGFAFKSKDFGSFEDKVIKITHIVPPTVAMDSLVGVNLKKYDKGKLGRYVAGVGDYVLAMTGATVGKLGRIEHGHAYINQRVLLFKNYTNVDKDFLYYVLSQRIFEQYVLNYIDSESAQANISAGTIGKFTFQMPPLGVQKKIGRLLRIIDEKCVLNKKINDNLEHQASLLVGQYMESTNSRVPFSDIMSFDSGFAFRSSTYLPSGKYRIITIKNIQDGYIDSTGAAFIDNLPPKMKSSCLLDIGDALLSLTGNVGRVGVVCEENLLLNQRVAKIVPKDKALLPFSYFIFRQPGIKMQLISIAKGTAQLNLSPVETLNLMVPYEKESARPLSLTLTPLYQTIIMNTQENIVLASLRDALLPKLMSGEIDVSDVKL